MAIITVPDRPKVLLLDDDPGMLGKLEAMLDQWGFRTVTASDADKAFDILVHDEEINVAVVDYMLQGMNGFELCRKIRSKLHSSTLHILILTAKSGKAQIVEGLGAGADDFLSKPFHPDELRSRLLAGARSAKVQAELRRQLGQFETALRLLGQALQFVPRCESCRKVRDLDGNWHKLKVSINFGEEDAKRHHFLCPECEVKGAQPTSPEPASSPAATPPPQAEAPKLV